MRWHEGPQAWEEILQRSKLPFEEIPEDKRGRELARLFFPYESAETTANYAEPESGYLGSVYALYDDGSVLEFANVEKCAKHYRVPLSVVQIYIEEQGKCLDGCYLRKGGLNDNKYYIVEFEIGGQDRYETIKEVADVFEVYEYTVERWIRSRQFQKRGKGKGFKFLCIKE